MLDKELSIKAVLDVLAAAIDKGQPWAIRLALAYNWGLPKPLAKPPPRRAGVAVTWQAGGEPS